MYLSFVIKKRQRNRKIRDGRHIINNHDRKGREERAADRRHRRAGSIGRWSTAGRPSDPTGPLTLLLLQVPRSEFRGRAHK